MSETVCIHGIPVDPWYIHCPKCQAMPPVEAKTADQDDDFCVECGHNHIGPCADEGQPDPDYGGAFDGTTVSSDADPDLASSDDYIRDEAVARIVDQYQGDVLFCDHADCDIYTTDLAGGDIIRHPILDLYLCVRHR